jgi:vacuolar-type H+-ATPase subunit C/Vma6
MRDYADEVYLHARIYAMRSRLLSLKDYVSLARNQGEALYGNAEGVPDPAEAGEIVFREQTASIIRLAETTAIYAPLFLSFFRQFEALNAKLILARAFGFQSLEQWYDIGQYATLDRSLLKKTTPLQDILPLLKGTYLAHVLEDVSSFEQTEIRVDLCSARDLYAASGLFKADAKLDFQNLIGRRIAVTSAILSLRLKKTYQWDEERTRVYLAKFHEAFDGETLMHIKILEEVVDRHLEHLRANGMQEPSLVDIEHFLEQHYYKWISSMFHRDFHSICCVVAYLWMLYYQIRNLIKIIEGRRFGYSPERILANIVCNT